MPRLTKCIYGTNEIGIEEALRIRDHIGINKRHTLNFKCPICGKQVRAHEEGGSAHFEHTERNEKCPKSDPLR